MVAEVGFFIALHQIIVALRRSQAPSCVLLAWGTALVKNATPWRFSLCEHCPVPSHSRPSSVAGSLLCAPCLGDSACKKRHTVAFFTALPTPSAAALRLSEVVKHRPHFRNQRKKAPFWVPLRCARAIKKIFLPFCLRDLNLTGYSVSSSSVTSNPPINITFMRSFDSTTMHSIICLTT